MGNPGMVASEMEKKVFLCRRSCSSFVRLGANLAELQRYHMIL
jgi:hypothetical protein